MNVSILEEFIVGTVVVCMNGKWFGTTKTHLTKTYILKKEVAVVLCIGRGSMIAIVARVPPKNTEERKDRLIEILGRVEKPLTKDDIKVVIKWLEEIKEKI